MASLIHSFVSRYDAYILLQKCIPCHYTPVYYVTTLYTVCSPANDRQRKCCYLYEKRTKSKHFLANTVRPYDVVR